MMNLTHAVNALGAYASVRFLLLAFCRWWICVRRYESVFEADLLKLLPLISPQKLDIRTALLAGTSSLCGRFCLSHNDVSQRCICLQHAAFFDGRAQRAAGFSC